jgi:Heterokaryon incompatibility protein (HET)
LFWLPLHELMHPFLAFLRDFVAYLLLCISAAILFIMSKTPVLCKECQSRFFEGYSYSHEHTPKVPPPPPEFEYEHLPDKRRSMRLLQLFASSPENPQIECKLVSVDIDPKKLTRGSIKTEYEALSWCWGPPQATSTSYINIRKNERMYSKKVQPDLLAALKALRHPQEDRYLWIDAICVNQADIGERNHQVEMMSIIYGQAKSV